MAATRCNLFIVIFKIVVILDLLVGLNFHSFGLVHAIYMYIFFLQCDKPETCLSVGSSPLTHHFMCKYYTRL
jgi:hypothetical protein